MLAVVAAEVVALLKHLVELVVVELVQQTQQLEPQAQQTQAEAVVVGVLLEMAAQAVQA
jgi:hypothetical protein